MLRTPPPTDPLEGTVCRATIIRPAGWVDAAAAIAAGENNGEGAMAHPRKRARILRQWQEDLRLEAAMPKPTLASADETLLPEHSGQPHPASGSPVRQRRLSASSHAPMAPGNPGSPAPPPPAAGAKRPAPPPLTPNVHGGTVPETPQQGALGATPATPSDAGCGSAAADTPGTPGGEKRKLSMRDYMLARKKAAADAQASEAPLAPAAPAAQSVGVVPANRPGLPAPPRPGKGELGEAPLLRGRSSPALGVAGEPPPLPPQPQRQDWVTRLRNGNSGGGSNGGGGAPLPRLAEWDRQHSPTPPRPGSQQPPQHVGHDGGGEPPRWGWQDRHVAADRQRRHSTPAPPGAHGWQGPPGGPEHGPYGRQQQQHPGNHQQAGYRREDRDRLLGPRTTSNPPSQQAYYRQQQFQQQQQQAGRR